MIRPLATFSALAVAVALAACTVHQSDSAPPLTGPSDFAQSISITATPDTIVQDGSQSAIVITVRDVNGKPAVGVPLRLDMLVGGTLVDFGTLSPRAPVTGQDGTASARYTAPGPPPPASGGTGTLIDIVASPNGSNAQASARNGATATIRLVPPGVILPPAGSPTASFTVSPTPAGLNVPLNLDASSSTPGTGASAIRTYVWSLGDGSTASGRTVTKTFAATGTFNVTLTVTNDRGLAASTTQAVSVGTTTGPTAAFTFSPTTPVVNQAVNFNAIASSAAPGRSIDSYTWNFGDGSATKTGPTAQHDFGTAGTYGVTLTVTDDTGQRTTVTQSVIVAPGAGGGTPVPPTATFVFSPTSPQVNQSVNFNAEASRPGAGRTIVSYGWNFGDTGTATGTTPAHSFTTVGTYNVTLVVIDDIGQRSTFVQPVIVSAGGGGGGATVAAFTFSPLAPSALQPVFFNASGSSTTTGHTLTTYLWNFGDGTLVTGNTFSVTHTFTAAGTFSVTLIVEDEIGQTGRTTTPVVVTAAGAGSLTAEFTISPLDPRSGQLVTFNANLSAPVGSITAYDWDFGDGLILNGLASFITSHTYFTLTGNDFTVRLTVHDNTGRVATTTKVLKVISGNDPVASFTVSQSPTTVGTAVTFDGGASVPIAPKTIVRYTWDYGDGSAIVSTAPGSSTSHSYSSVGTFVVRLTVTDSEGLTASTTRTLQVQ